MSTQTKAKAFTAHPHEIRRMLEHGEGQFRRVVKPQPDGVTGDGTPWVKRFITCVDDTVQPPQLIETDKTRDGAQICKRIACPYGAPGDLLWVRIERVIYRADYDERDLAPGWKPSIRMPRWASRLTLEVTRVRVERVQEISPHDAYAEGVQPHPYVDDCPPDSRCIQAFAELWDSINAKKGHGWDTNPWVWAVDFKVRED